MVDMGGGGRERFHGLVEDAEEVLPPVSSVSYYSPSYNVLKTSPWRQSLQGSQDNLSRNNQVLVVPGQVVDLYEVNNDLIQIKSDPEITARLCGGPTNHGGSSTSLEPHGGDATGLEAHGSTLEAAEDARAKGQLLQEITREAETFHSYSPSPTPGGCYRTFAIAPEQPQPSHTDYLCPFSDSGEWVWSRGNSLSEDRSVMGSGGGGGTVIVTSGPPIDGIIGPLHYTVPSHLVPDAFSGPLPSLAVTQSQPSPPPLSGPVMQRSVQSSSALDLSPVSQQLPPLQSSLIPNTAHIPTSPNHQLSSLQPSITTLDMPHSIPSPHSLPPSHTLPSPHSLPPSHTLPSQHELEGALDMVAVEGSAAAHETTRVFERGHECNQCGSMFVRYSHLKHHMKTHMEEAKAAGEKEDQITAVDEAQETRRIRRPKTSVAPHKCKDCGVSCASLEKLKAHEAKHSGERPFKCSECSSTFSSKAMRLKHKKIHSGEKPYSCDECSTRFTESGSLKVHKRLHSGEKPFKCDQCDVAFNGAGMLATHKRKHTGEKPYMCVDCGETFRLLSTLKSHRRRHTGEKPFVCELCGSSFTQRAALQRHKRIHSDNKPWECEQCGFRFRDKENLRKHIALHKIKSQHTCDVCGAGFNHAKKLDTHKMLHNGGDRPFSCNKCSSAFTSHKYLMQHKRRVHNGKDAGIQCDVCSAKFKRKETLRAHLGIHKRDKGYHACEECGATYNQRGSLTKHKRIHMVDSRSDLCICKTCGMTFKDKAALDEHSDTHTFQQSVIDDPFTCPTCHQVFSSQRDLIKHKKANHPVQRSASTTVGYDSSVEDSNEPIRDRYVCEDCDQTFFRRRQLKAHKEYCPCRGAAMQPEPPKAVGTVGVSLLHTESKEVDAMKLLTAVLAVTGTDTGDGVCHNSSSQDSLDPTILPVPQSAHRYPSPGTIVSSQDLIFHPSSQEQTHLQPLQPDALCLSRSEHIASSHTSQHSHQHSHTPQPHPHTPQPHPHAHTPQPHQHSHTLQSHQHTHTSQSHQHSHTQLSHQHTNTPHQHTHTSHQHTNTSHQHTNTSHQHTHTSQPHQHTNTPHPHQHTHTSQPHQHTHTSQPHHLAPLQHHIRQSEQLAEQPQQLDHLHHLHEQQNQQLSQPIDCGSQQTETHHTQHLHHSQIQQPSQEVQQHLDIHIHHHSVIFMEEVRSTFYKTSPVHLSSHHSQDDEDPLDQQSIESSSLPDPQDCTSEPQQLPEHLDESTLEQHDDLNHLKPHHLQ